MKVVKIRTGRWYLRALLIGILLFSSAAVNAQQVFFTPSTVHVELGESVLVAVEVAEVPETGLAAFQFDMNFDPAVVNVFDPNADYSDTFDPFVPLGGNIFCNLVRGTQTCEDPEWFLTSTGRTAVAADNIIDNDNGLVQVAYGTRGDQMLPVGRGVIALIEIHGVVDGVETVMIDPDNFIIADAGEPPYEYTVESFGTLTVTVGTGGVINNPPVLGPIGNQSVDEGATLIVPLGASDLDGDLLSFTQTGLPDFCSLSDSGGGIGSMECQPDYGDAGVFNVTITVADNGIPKLDDSETFNLTIVGDDVAVAPTTPDKLSAKANHGQVELSWKGSETATNFIIFRKLSFKNKSLNEADFSEIGQTSDRQYVDIIAEEAKFASYFIIAENELGASDASKVKKVHIK